MEFTSEVRKDNYSKFLNIFMKLSEKKNKNGEYKYSHALNMFKLKKIASGAEGVVYKAKFKKSKESKEYKDSLVIKIVDLIKIKDSKVVSDRELKTSAIDFYQLFESKYALKSSSLIELLSQKLINQLVYQKICPNYSLNYYWDYTDDKIISIYNEYVNSKDFHYWASKTRSTKLWFNAIFQIMIGLITMKRHYNMSHTDFHTKNILVQKVKAGGYWEYIIDGNSYYLPNLGYVFLIHDFGFSWIPKKMYMKWHYNATLSYLTKSGKEFYDMATFLSIILNSKDILIPESVKETLQEVFFEEELDLLFTKEYYVNQYNKILQSSKSENVKKSYLNKLQKYPNIDKNFSATDLTLEDKLNYMFYTKRDDVKSKQYFIYGDKEYHTKNSNKIETYNIDKSVDKDTLQDNLKDLVQY